MDLEEKVKLITRNLQEISDVDGLREIVSQRPLKIYWGTATTGKPHLGYLVPLLKIRDFCLAGCKVKILFADIHGFLDNLKAPIEKVELRCIYYENLIKSILTSLNVDLSSIEFIRGGSFQKKSDYVFDLYKISTLTSLNAVKRAGAQVVKQSDNPLLSSLIYPNMQALDEEYLDVDCQFGGIDQRKIFMHARTFLPKIGYRRRIHLMNYMMPGLNSDKMSSSDLNSKIDFSDTPGKISKKIAKIFCCEGNVETGVLTLYKFLIYPLNKHSIEINKVAYNTYEELEKAFGEGKIHPKDIKDNCYDMINQIVSPIRDEMLKDAELERKAYL